MFESDLPLRLARSVRLKHDSQTRPRCLSKAFQSVGGWTDLAAFDARNVGLRGLHASSQLRLREARCGPRLDQRAGEVEFLSEGVISVRVVRVLAPSAMEVADLRHGFTSLARCSARSISALGVFSVFLMKVLTMTTRCSRAVM